MQLDSRVTKYKYRIAHVLSLYQTRPYSVGTSKAFVMKYFFSVYTSYNGKKHGSISE